MTGAKLSLVATFVFAVFCVGAPASPVDHYGVADLATTADALKTKAAASGSASITLAQYPNHRTMLSYRNKDGGGELHVKEADIFYVVRGKAMLVTEGTLEGSHEESPGELRGTKVAGGTTTALREGDVVHIPAGTTHQLLVAPGDEFLYFVVKIKEHD